MFYCRYKCREKCKNYGNSNFNNRPDNNPLLSNSKIKYFLPEPSKESDKTASTEITKQLQKEFEDVFTGIGYRVF